jgi:membrane associated rhomboid family serine protease
MLLIPLETDVKPRRPPVANWLLVGANVLIFLLTSASPVWAVVERHFTLNAAVPALSQYLTYQFLHGDLAHLAGNMLFLWVFGNAVCDRMGSVGYLLFYLAGGIFAGLVFTHYNHNPLLGASGSIAAVTTAFLVLFPRTRITMVLWAIIVTTFQLPAMVLIVIKIILWDNIVAPYFDRGLLSNVAYSAHWGGYAFGLIVPLLLLAVGALPRNQFDLLAIGRRWQRRMGLELEADGGRRPLRPHAVRVEEMGSRPLGQIELSPLELLREDVLDRLAEHDLAEAARLYLRLLEQDPRQVLPRAPQLELANWLAQSGRPAEAARAYELFLGAYPGAPDCPQVHLLLGLIYLRYLAEPLRAASHLRAALESLTLESQRALAESALRDAIGQAGQRGLDPAPGSQI